MPKKQKKSRTRHPSAAPSKPLSREQFERELRKVVDGDPEADADVKAFWRDFSNAIDLQVAVPRALVIEVIRKQVGR